MLRGDTKTSAAAVVTAAFVLISLLLQWPLATATQPSSAGILTNVPPTFIQDPEDPTLGDYGILLTFRIVVYDADGDNLTVTWDWGDGTTDTDTTIPAKPAKVVIRDHAYYPGPYGEWASENYTLNVTIDDGNGSSAWDHTLVCVNRPLNFSPSINDILVFGQEPKIRVNPGDEVTIVANASDPEGDPLNWTYTLSDSVGPYEWVLNHTGATAPGEDVWSNITCIFSAAGTYTILLSVSDAPIPYDVFPHNISEEVMVQVFDNEAPLMSSVVGVFPEPLIDSATGYVNVSFSVEVCDPDGDPITVVWDFGRGVTFTNVTVGVLLVKLVQYMNFTHEDTWYLTVTVTDGVPGHEVAVNRTIVVTSNNEPPSLVKFVYDSTEGPPVTTTVFVGQELVFEAFISDPEKNTIQVIWDFGDGTPLTFENVSVYDDWNVSATIHHTYAVAGDHTLLFRYTDNWNGIGVHNRSYSLLIVVEVDDAPPVADAGDPQIVSTSVMTFLDGTGSTDNWYIVNYTWTFVHNGTLVELYGPTPWFVFWTAGVYEVTLNVTDRAGNSNESTVNIQVVDVIPEFGDFTPVVAFLVIVLLLRVVAGRRRPR